jgi:hypothetical protein
MCWGFFFSTATFKASHAVFIAATISVVTLYAAWLWEVLGDSGTIGHPGFKQDIQDLPRLRQWRKKLWPKNRHRIEPLDGDCGDLYAALWPIASAQFDLNWHGG